MLADATPGPPDHAQRVGLVHQEERTVALLELDDPIERREIAVHAVHGLDRDEHAAGFGPGLGQQTPERVRVVVRERAAARARELGPGQDAVVGQAVMQDDVPLIEQAADHAHVGGVAADHDESVLAAEEVSDGALQVVVEGPLARSDPAGRH